MDARIVSSESVMIKDEKEGKEKPMIIVNLQTLLTPTEFNVLMEKSKNWDVKLDLK